MIKDRPTQLKVNLDAVLNNYNHLVDLAGDKTGLAIVKADSYGLGSGVIAKHLYNNGVRHFAVATLEEAIKLRELVGDSLILVLGVSDPRNVKYAVEKNISLTCPSKEWLEEVIDQLDKVDGKLKIHVKLETGMNRIGVSDKIELSEIDKLLKNEKVIFEGVFSHYSNADSDNTKYDEYQTNNFKELFKIFTKTPEYIHIENSAGTIRYAERKDNFNLSRLGIALYGCYPSEHIEHLNNIELEPVVSLISKVKHVKKVAKGTKIGYGATYEAKDDEYIATIPMGYADGLLRRAQGFKVNVAGYPCEIVGRVCMDQFMVRVPKDVKVGDDVLIFGEHNGEKISVDEFANYQQTISYEIFCCINQRVPRKYYINNTEL